MLFDRSVFNISECAGVDHSKHLLDVVHLERDAQGNALAVTTDGKRFLVAKWKDHAKSLDYFEQSEKEANVTAVPTFETNIAIKPWDEIQKAIPKKCKKPALEHALLPETEVGKTIPLETREDDGTVRRITAKPVEGVFPNWRESLPSYNLLVSSPGSNDAVRVRVPAEQFASLMKAVWATSGKNTMDYVDLIVPMNALRPVEIRSNNLDGIKVTGFLTPIMAEDSKTPFDGALPAPKSVAKPEVKPEPTPSVEVVSVTETAK
jgi:hypothetical protein